MTFEMAAARHLEFSKFAILVSDRRQHMTVHSHTKFDAELWPKYQWCSPRGQALVSRPFLWPWTWNNGLGIIGPGLGCGRGLETIFWHHLQMQENNNSYNNKLTIIYLCVINNNWIPQQKSIKIQSITYPVTLSDVLISAIAVCSKELASGPLASGPWPLPRRSCPWPWVLRPWPSDFDHDYITVKYYFENGSCPALWTGDVGHVLSFRK